MTTVGVNAHRTPHLAGNANGETSTDRGDDAGTNLSSAGNPKANGDRRFLPSSLRGSQHRSASQEHTTAATKFTY